MSGELLREPVPRIGLLWQYEPGSTDNSSRSPERYAPLIGAFSELGVVAEPVLYSADATENARAQLLGLDGVLVWVNPVEGGANRAPLDALLREVALEGVWVSAHPDVILSMGTKEVLYRTRELGWGADTDRYQSPAEFRERFPARLAQQGLRIVKQGRGNGGDGVWKVELLESSISTSPPGPDSLVEIQQARGKGAPEQVRLAEFIDRCEAYFDWSGCLVDQPFQPRLAEGMIRCYLVHDEVVGFSHQGQKSFLEPSMQSMKLTARSPMQGPETAAYQELRSKVELEWVPQMKALLGLATPSLPAIWDADFFLGPKTESGKDSYVLCEINVSAVWPFPSDAIRPLATAAAARVHHNHTHRS